MNLTQLCCEPILTRPKGQMDCHSYAYQTTRLPSIHSLFPDIFQEGANNFTSPVSTACSTPSMTNSSPKIPSYESSTSSFNLSSQSPPETSATRVEDSMTCTSFNLDDGLSNLPSDCFKVLVPSGHRPLAPKRKRANSKQLEVLQKVYEMNKFPNGVLREQLAKQLGMTMRGVQIWFQNQRQGNKERTKGGKTHSSPPQLYKSFN